MYFNDSHECVILNKLKDYEWNSILKEYINMQEMHASY